MESTGTTEATEFAAPPDFTDLTGDGGAFKKVLKPGSGAATPCDQDQVFVHYTGTLFGGERDGQKFDSSRDRDEPFNFKLGTKAVIKGWDVAVKTMQLGEEADIILRADYAYGKDGSGASIPPNAPLKFNIELLRWEGEDVTVAKDKGVVKSCLRKGEGFMNPKDGAMVTVTLVGTHEGREFDSRTGVTFEVGLAEESGLPAAIDLGVKAMAKGEKARIVAKGAYAASQTARDAGVADGPEVQVAYEVELTEFEKAKESWELSDEEKVAQAELFKAKGTDYFKKARLRPALKYYNRVVDFLKWDSSFDDKPEELRGQRRAVLLAARLNLSLVHFKLGDHHKCIEEADEAIKLDGGAAKAYFRRGQARMAVHDYEDAKQDFEKVAELEPGNHAAVQNAAKARQGILDERNRQKKTFFGMFDKFAKRDATGTSDAAAAPPAAKPCGENGGEKAGDAATAEPATMET